MPWKTRFLKLSSKGQNDWAIDNPASVDAQFFSESAGIRIGIAGLFFKKHGFQVAFTTEEYEKAADALKDLEVPSEFAAQEPSAIEKDASPSTKEALVRAPRRPGKARPATVAEPPNAP